MDSAPFTHKYASFLTLFTFSDRRWEISIFNISIHVDILFIDSNRLECHPYLRFWGLFLQSLSAIQPSSICLQRVHADVIAKATQSYRTTRWNRVAKAHPSPTIRARLMKDGEADVVILWHWKRCIAWSPLLRCFSVVFWPSGIYIKPCLTFSCFQMLSTFACTRRGTGCNMIALVIGTNHQTTTETGKVPL